MVGHDRVNRLQQRGFFHWLQRLVVATKLEKCPGQTVDDVALFRVAGDGLFDHAQRLVQLFAPVNQPVTKIIQDLWLGRIEGKSLTEVGLCRRPFL